MAKPKLHKKMTVKAVRGTKIPTGGPFEKDAPEGTEVVVMTVLGRADSHESGTNTLPNGDVSEYVKFRGEFAAYAGRLKEGQEHRSNVLIMPDVAGGMLAGLMGREDVQSVQFGFEISVAKTTTSIGYEYKATPLMETDESDPLTALTARIAANALPAPEAPKATGRRAKKEEAAQATA